MNHLHLLARPWIGLGLLLFFASLTCQSWSQEPVRGQYQFRSVGAVKRSAPVYQAYKATLDAVFGPDARKEMRAQPISRATAATVELNGDGVDDYVFVLDGYCGALGCTVHFAISDGGSWKVTKSCFNYVIEYGMDVLQTQSAGLRDIRLDLDILKFNGSTYCRPRPLGERI